MTAISIHFPGPSETARATAECPRLQRLQSSAIHISDRLGTAPDEGFDDGWRPEEKPEPLAAELVWVRPGRVIDRRETRGGAFDRSIDPYRTCEEGGVFCIGDAPHENAGLLPGLDFESRLTILDRAAEILERELASPAYWPAPVVIGAGGDPYPPAERQYAVTRSLIEVLYRARHPAAIVTKSNLVLRDLDILSAMGRERLVKVFVPVTTLDREVARRMQPRAPSPERRLQAIEALNDAGVPAGVMAAPIIPAINDSEIETILMRAYGAGAREAGYSVLRLGRELSDRFRERLLAHYPQRLRRAIALMQSMVDDDRLTVGARRGLPAARSGTYAWMIKRRFEAAVRRLGYRETPAALRTDLFRPPLLSPSGAGRAPIVVSLPRLKPRRRPRRLADQALRRQ